MLYESAPMYVTDQPAFLNGAACVLTTLSPHQLMKACQQVEKTLGRVKMVEKGARTIDLDVLLYDKEKVNTADLVVPHIGIAERDFVKVPLSEYAQA
jgi:2-amino-4-hydroxy-6-hydroxymethyldihydropteridine diphosphokinase